MTTVITEPTITPDAPPITARERIYLDREVEAREVFTAERPITFEEWLDICGPKDYRELIDGALVEKPMVQWQHEDLQGWLLIVLRQYVDEKGLGKVGGSRTATPINEFRGRLPDVLFVRKERIDIVQQKAVYGPPDLVIEIRSPSDRASGVVALEADYRNVGVQEICFLDPRRGMARLLRKRENGYEETEQTEGALRFETVDGFEVQLEWLFQEPRPSAYGTVTRLLSVPPR